MHGRRAEMSDRFAPLVPYVDKDYARGLALWPLRATSFRNRKPLMSSAMPF